MTAAAQNKFINCLRLSLAHLLFKVLVFAMPISGSQRAFFREHSNRVTLPAKAVPGIVTVAFCKRRRGGIACNSTLCRSGFLSCEIAAQRPPTRLGPALGASMRSPGEMPA